MKKTITEYWKKMTIVLAIPMMILNTILDYYNGWESRTESRHEDYRLRWFILAHEHDEDGEVDWSDLRKKGYGDMIPTGNIPVLINTIQIVSLYAIPFMVFYLNKK